MNKIFKVVWSKTKECYVVVSEVAKNNGGKKKALASVLAGLAMVAAAGAVGTPVQAGDNYGNSAINISPDNVPAGYGPNKVSTNSIVVGYGNDTKTNVAGNGHVAYGFNNTATEETTTALGGGNKATGPAATAVGSFNEATGRSSVAIGNVAKANNLGNVAIGSYAKALTSGTFTNVNNQVETKGYAVALGGFAEATEHGTVAVGSISKASGFKATAVGAGAQATNKQATAVGNASVASGENASAFGYNNKVTGDNSTALGTGNTIDGTSVAGAVAVGNKNNASGDRAIAIGETNTSKVEDTITMGTSNTASTGGGIAIGKNNLADSTNRGTKTGDGRGNENSQIAIGRDNEATHIDTVAVGREVKSTGTGAVGLGSRINATGDYAVAIGNSSAGGTVEAGDYAVAVGFKAKATGGRSIAQGGAATAAADRSIAMGLRSNVQDQKASSTYTYSGTGGAVVGGVNTTTKTIHKGTGTETATDIYESGDEIAIGSSATVSNESNAAVVIGKGAKTEGNAHYSVVVGKGSYANASDGVVVGQDSYVKARESVAIGQGANVSNAGSVRSQAIGFGATVTGTNAYDATAIGATAQVTDVTGGVALGSGSESARKTSDNENVGFNSKYVDGTRVRNRAYTADLTGAGNQWDDGSINTGAVSVGNDTQKRQIINVAAGNKDTDAVNVAQLKNVGVRVGADTNTATIGTNKVAADFLAYNGQLNIKGDSNRVTTVSENDANGKDANVNVKFDYDGLVKAKAGSSVTVNQKTEGGKTVFEIDAPAATGGTTSTEKVQAKADVAGSSDKNIAKVAPKAGENFGDVGATYEVNVSRNDVKDAAREAVTVNNGGTTTGGTYTADTNNPISVTATKDDNNHNTSYAVTFDGDKAAKQIPLTYKANGAGDKTVKLDKGLDFTNGTNTTAEIGNDGVVKFNLNDKVTLTDAGSVTIGDTKVNNDGLTITGGPSITKTGGINAGNQKVTNVAPGTISSTSTDAVNGSQLYDVDQKFNNTVKLTGNAGATDGQALNKTGGLSFGVVGANSGKYISTTANGSDVTVDLSTDAKKLLNNTVEVKGKNAATVTTSTETTADGGTKTIYTVDVANTGTVAKSSWNIKSSADTANGGATATGHEVAAKNIADTNNVEMVAGKNLIVKQTSDANGATVEYALAKDLKDLNSVTTDKTITKEITLKDPSGTGETVIKRDGDRITYNTPGSTTVNKVANLADEKHITATTAGNEYTVDANGNVTMTYTDGNGTLVNGEKAVIKGIAKQDLSNIDNAGKKVITGLGSIVEAGDNVTVTSTENTTTGQKTYTVNAVTPAVYTTPDGEKLTKDKDGKFHKVGETAEYTGDIITSFENPKAAAGQTTKDGGMIVNNIGSAIKNQTPTMPAGQTATYLDKLKAAADAGSNVKNAAVNVSDLHNTAEALRANELHIAPTAVKANSTEVKGGELNTAGTENVYKYDAATKKVTLTYNDGNGKAVTDTKAVIDFSALNTGGTTASTWTAKTSAENTTAGSEVGKHAGNDSQVIGNQNSVDFQAGRNMTVKQTNDGNGNTTINYALDKDLTNLDKVVVNGKDGQAGKDGVTIVGPQGATGAPGVPGTNGIDGKVGITGKDGKDAVSIAGKDGVGTIGLTGPQGPAGADGKGVDISTDHGTQTLVKPEANNGNKSERIVYVPKDKDGNPLNDTDGNPIKREVATMDDGLKFAGDDGQTNANKVIAKQLNQQVDIIGGATGDLSDNNIGINNDNGKLKVQLAKDVNLTPTGSLTTGDTKVNNDGITIKAPTPAAGATPTTDVKLTNTGLDNGGNKITNVKAGENDTDAVNVKQLKANRTEVKAGDNVVVTSDVDATDNHTVYTVNAVTPAVYTTPDGEKLTKDKDGKFHKVGETAEYTGDVITSFENPKAAAGQTTKDGGMIVNNIGSAIKNQTPTMPAGQTATYLDKLKAAADAGSNVKNAAVNVSDLHNTAEALKATELHIAPTVGGNDADKGGVASGNTNPGAEAQAYKYNATTKQVELTFNDGNGKAVTGPKAVIDLSDLAGSIQNYSFKTNAIAGDGKLDGTATATAVENGGTVNFEAGKNLTVKQTVNAAAKTQTYTYSLDKDLTNLDKVVVNGKDGQAGKDGVTIVGPQGATGTPGTNGIDGKVGITGKDGKDAVSIAGKDGVGTIGLTGPQGPAGADGKGVDISTDHGTQTLVKPEANNGNKSERIVYVPKDKDGNPLNDTDGNPIKREVATMDDGLKFAGDDGQTNANKVIAKQLNQQVDIIGGATGTLTDNNIGVNNDGNGKLKVQLAKDVNLTDTGSIKFGDTADDNTVINKGGITITKPAAGTDPAKTVSLTGDGLNNGGNKITNVKAGENDTDAVNVKQLKDKVTTVESSNNSIKVVDKNAPTSATYDAAKGHQYDITINNQSVVENAQTPVVYTDKDGNKLYLVDGKFYKTPTPTPTDQEVPATDVIASMNNGGNSTTDPMKLNNVGSSIVDHATPGVTTPTFLDKLNAAANDTKTQNGAVNVTDLKSTADDLIDKGLKFTANSGGVKTNKLGSTVKVLGEGAKADTEYSGENVKTIIGQDTDGNTTIDVKLDKNLKSETITVTGKDGKDGKIGINGKDGTNGVDGTNRVDIQVEKGVDGIDGKNGADGISRIVYEDKTGKHTVATMEDGLAFKGDNTTIVKKKLGEQLDIVGGATGTLTDNNIGVNEDNGKLKVQLAKDVDLTKDGSLTIGDTVVNKDGIKIANADPNKTVSLTGSGLNNGGNTITNVAAGKNDTDAVNVKQLKDNVTTVTSSDNSISVTDTNTDASKGHAYDIKVNSQGVVNKAQTPVVYTKQDGTKVYLVGDKFYDNPQGTGTEVPKSDVIASMNNADGSTTNPMKLNNVGSSIADKAGNTFLDKIDAAAGDNNTKNGAVNVSDLKNTADAIGNKGLNFGTQSTGANSEIHKNLGEKLEIVGEGTKADDNYSASNIKTMTKDGKVVIGLDKDLNGLNSIGVPGKDGVAGKDGVSISGKDGANGIDGKVSIGKDGKDAVSIAGKDGVGHIGLTGPQGPAGADGTGVDISTDHGSKTLVKPEANNGDKSERIVYVPKDKDGNPLKDTDGNPIKREVATMDDGLRFTGNNTDTENKHALNTLVKVQGEGVTAAESTAFQSAAGNINVVADGNDTLTVKLNKDLKGINSIKNSDNGPALNFNAGDLSVTGGNLNMGGNKITNLGKGTNDTDAVNLKQLKDSRTIVKSTDGSVGVRESESADGAKVYDLSTGASPRFDELTDEIGRVGAQGAALAALKPIQYDPLEPTQIMAGYGNYRGNSAIAMGVAHYKNESTMMHAGLAWAGGSRHMMANAGVTWKVGNRDSEAAVADRYRKGPISSAYAMQQEMASVKAQNAGLKTEVSDLKAENEQMKAQIAAMMAKLGM